jgi:hypothetical protein
MLPIAIQTKILADIAGARADLRSASRAGQPPANAQNRMTVTMARAMRAISEAQGACLVRDLRDISFTPAEIETYGANAARVACQRGFEAVDADQLLEAA